MAKAVYLLAGLALGGAALYALRGVLTPVFFAFLLAYILDPLVDRLERLRLPRGAATSILLVGALLGLGLFLLLAAPALMRDVSTLLKQLPVAASRVLALGAELASSYGVEVPTSAGEVLSRFEGDLGALSQQAVAPLRSVLGTLLGGTASALGAAAAAVMVPIFTFYLLQDFDHIVAKLRELLPVTQRAGIVSMAREVDEVLGQFFRGQLTVMLILAALYAAGYALVGVRLALPIGVMAGLVSFIPYVGGAVALGLALLMSLLHFAGVGQLVAIVAVYAVIQVLEGFVITPRIVGDKLGLSPVWVLFALMVGGELFGFMGVMLSLPAAAVVKVFVLHALERYRQSGLFLGTASLQGAVAADGIAAPRLRHRPRVGRRRRLRGAR